MERVSKKFCQERRGLEDSGQELSEKFREVYGEQGQEALVAFTHDPRIHGEFEQGKKHEGYYAGLPYAPALGLYFVRCALCPDGMQENYRQFVQDLNAIATNMYRSNKDSQELKALKVIKEDGAVRLHDKDVPPQLYLEEIVNDRLEETGVFTSRYKNLETPDSEDLLHPPSR